jgi:hypothetical protein
MKSPTSQKHEEGPDGYHAASTAPNTSDWDSFFVASTKALPTGDFMEERADQREIERLTDGPKSERSSGS